MYLLSKQGKTFLAKCRIKDPNRARRIEKVASRVFDNGVSWARSAEVITEMFAGKQDVAVFEAHVKGTVIRVATYLHQGMIPIYLFDFDTHSGSKNNLAQHHIDKAVAQAKIAKQCSDYFDFYEYEEHRK